MKKIKTMSSITAFTLSLLVAGYGLSLDTSQTMSLEPCNCLVFQPPGTGSGGLMNRVTWTCEAVPCFESPGGGF